MSQSLNTAEYMDALLNMVSRYGDIATEMMAQLKQEQVPLKIICILLAIVFNVWTFRQDWSSKKGLRAHEMQ